VAEDCDICQGFDDGLDSDGDTTPDGCDICAGFDDRLDDDVDGVPDGCDLCDEHDDALDDDFDDVPDGCDICAFADDNVDSDFDTIPDGCDVCQGFDDLLDGDADGVVDGCDSCQGFDDAVDADGDLVPDGCDICSGFDDLIDTDGDGLPNGCDQCEGPDDNIDGDGDGVPDGCDTCPGFDDAVDVDGDGNPDGCDACPGFDDAADADGDGTADGCDVCPGFDDGLDSDGDTVPDDCDLCAGASDFDDADADGAPDGCDLCPGFNDADDADGDTIPDACDQCAGDDLADLDLDTVPDDCDACPGFDDRDDGDTDLIPDGCDVCLGFDDNVDTDADGTADGCDLCPGYPDDLDTDIDGIPDDCDPCPGTGTQEIFLPNSDPRSDILFVVDNSCSMGGEQAQLVANFGSFIDEMIGAGADWQVAVITTDNPNFQGQVITSLSPDPGGMFATQASVGTGGSGSERGIDQAWQAIHPGGMAAPLAASGFWRDDALFAIVFVSDEPDQSINTPAAFVNYANGLKGNDPELVRAHAIVGDVPVSACGGASPGTGYSTAVALTGGELISICGTDWGLDLAQVARNSIPALVFPLSAVPVPVTVEVFDDGLPVYEGWVYDLQANAIVFDSGDRLWAGAIVEIEYVTDCGGVVGACSDGLDNDGDGLVDYPLEPGCLSAYDTNETDPLNPGECANGGDDDGDGATDYPADPECVSAAHEFEACIDFADDVFGYRACGEPTASVPCPDLQLVGVPLGLSDDDFIQVPIGFDFDFYGRTHTTANIGSNGVIDLTNAGIITLGNNACMPGESYDGRIYAWWDDLNPGAGGEVYYRTAGAPPNQTFEVQWVTRHYSGGNTIDVRVVLHEGANDITVCYADTNFGNGSDGGASATVGIQGTSSAFIEYSCFTPDLIDGLTLRYRHP